MTNHSYDQFGLPMPQLMPQLPPNRDRIERTGDEASDTIRDLKAKLGRANALCRIRFDRIKQLEGHVEAASKWDAIRYDRIQEQNEEISRLRARVEELEEQLYAIGAGGVAGGLK